MCQGNKNPFEIIKLVHFHIYYLSRIEAALVDTLPVPSPPALRSSSLAILRTLKINKVKVTLMVSLHLYYSIHAQSIFTSPEFTFFLCFAPWTCCSYMNSELHGTLQTRHSYKLFFDWLVCGLFGIETPVSHTKLNENELA